MKPSPLPRLSIVFASLGLIVLAAGWICQILLSADYVKFVTYGCYALSFILIFLAMMFVLSFLKKDRKEAEAIKNQLIDMGEGKIVVRELGPATESLREVASAVNALPTLGENEVAQEGILPYEQFTHELKIRLARLTSIRAALILYGLDQKATPQSYDQLAKAVEEEHKGALLGAFKGGYAAFLPSALSSEEIEGKAKAFLTRFAAVENATSLKPTSIGAKIVVAFYPDYEGEELFARALEALSSPSTLTVLSSGQSNLTPSTLSESSRKDEATYEDFSIALSASSDRKSRQKALRLLLIKVGFGLGFDQIGVALYDASRGSYRIEEELHQEGKSLSFKALEKDGLVNGDRIDPYYDLALGSRLYYVSDSLSLPSRPAAILDSLGLRSICCLSIGSKDKKIGFVYLTSALTTPAPKPELQRAISRFFLVLKEYVLLAKDEFDEQEHARRMRLLTENAQRYVYEIDPATHRLLYLSENLATAFPKARLGMACHKALLGLDKPCPKCPLTNESSFKKALPSLGPGLLSFNALSKTPKALITLSKEEHNLTSRRLDLALYILNRRAMMADLESALLEEKRGIALLFNVENALMSAGKIKDGTIDDVMSAVVARLSIASLDEGLYRFSEACLGYLLPGANKEEAFALAIQVAEELYNPVALQDRSFVPELSYYMFDYPVEVSCTFDLESLMRTCMAKVANVGKGRLVPFDDSEATLVLPRTYKEDAIKKALNKGNFPLVYNPIHENASGRIRYVEAGIGIELVKGEKASPSDIRALIGEDRMLSKLEEGELSSFLAFYKANAKAFKASSLKGVVFYVGKNSIFSPTYMRTLSRGIKDAGIPRHYINLFLLDGIEEKEQEKYEKALGALADIKVNLIRNFDGTQEKGIAYLPKGDLLRARSTTLSDAALREILALAKERKVALVVPDIDRLEEQSYAISLAIPYGEGEFYGKEIHEEDFLKALGL